MLVCYNLNSFSFIQISSEVLKAFKNKTDAEQQTNCAYHFASEAASIQGTCFSLGGCKLAAKVKHT